MIVFARRRSENIFELISGRCSSHSDNAGVQADLELHCPHMIYVAALRVNRVYSMFLTQCRSRFAYADCVA